eukprot:SAG22_NODE_1764_length_3626_cov_2.854551_2_plen_77_part_00
MHEMCGQAQPASVLPPYLYKYAHQLFTIFICSGSQLRRFYFSHQRQHACFVLRRQPERPFCAPREPGAASRLVVRP